MTRRAWLAWGGIFLGMLSSKPLSAAEETPSAANRDAPIAHESAAEETQRIELAEQVRAIVHPSLQDFAQTLVYLETSQFKIWVDQTADGTRRYASWARSKPLSAEPDLRLTHGQLAVDQSTGQQTHTFQNADVVYHVLSSAQPGTGGPAIKVTQGEQVLLAQGARWVELATVVADPDPGPITFSPTGRETLQSFVELPRVDRAAAFQEFLSARGFTTLSEHGRSGPDPAPGNVHGDITSTTRTITIGSCNTVEAFWIFASFTQEDWLPRPDSEQLEWKAAWQDPALEVAVFDDPSNTNPYFGTLFLVFRDKSSGELVRYVLSSEFEGGNSETSMQKRDGYTWDLTSFALAD